VLQARLSYSDAHFVCIAPRHGAPVSLMLLLPGGSAAVSAGVVAGAMRARDLRKVRRSSS
jgi:hypothetical protein